LADTTADRRDNAALLNLPARDEPSYFGGVTDLTPETENIAGAKVQAVYRTANEPEVVYFAEL
jgi:hypothetical protein